MTERRCKDCGSAMMLSMVSLNSGIWMCTDKLCNFPLNSSELENYMETVKPIFNEANDSSKQFGIDQTSLWNNPRKTRTTKALSSSTRTTKSSTNSTVSSNDDSTSAWSSYKQCTKVYPLLQNDKTNLCWLNASLALLVTNQHIRRNLIESSIDSKLRQFVSEYIKCQESFSIKRDYNSVRDKLVKLRTDIWKTLQPDMALSPGQFDSPLFSLQSLFKLDPKLFEMTACQYQHDFHCKECGFLKQSKKETCLLSVPNCADDLHVPNCIGFVRDCFKCKCPDQINTISIEKSSDFIVIHCTDGFKRSKFVKDYFPWKRNKGDVEYFVSHIIQYTGSHYILWSFDLKNERWLKANDLENPVCTFKYKEPNFPEQEANIVVWQKVNDCSNPRTDRYNDEKILGSLTLKTSSISSSSSSSSFDNATKSSGMMATRPNMMKKWLKKVSTKPVVYECDNDLDSKCLEEQSLALGRYKPYISKRNRRQSSFCEKTKVSGKNVDISKEQSTQNENISVERNISGQKNGLYSFDETQAPNIHSQLSSQESIRAEFDKKEMFFDSAYSSPISDASDVYNHDNNNAYVRSGSCSVTRSNAFDAAMEMVDDLFRGRTPDELDSLSFSEIPSEENSLNYFGTEIDINKLL